MPGQPRLERGQRRKVDVAPRQVLAAGEEVDLVDEESVQLRGGHVKGEVQRDDGGDCSVHEAQDRAQRFVSPGVWDERSQSVTSVITSGADGEGSRSDGAPSVVLRGIARALLRSVW